MLFLQRSTCTIYEREWTMYVKQVLIYIYLYMHIYIVHHPLINQLKINKKSGAKFANPRCRVCKFNKCRICSISWCRIWQVPSCHIPHIRIPTTSGLTWRPKNSLLLWNKAHFFGLNFRLNSRKRSITLRRLARWSSKSVPRTKASSRKASIIFQVRPRNTKIMRQEKVAGALHNLNPIRAKSYRLY